MTKEAGDGAFIQCESHQWGDTHIKTQERTRAESGHTEPPKQTCGHQSQGETRIRQTCEHSSNGPSEPPQTLMR